MDDDWCLLVMNMFYCDCINEKNIGLLNYRHFHSLLRLQRCAVNVRLMGQSYHRSKASK
jgi:hypothetical protein